MIEIRLSLLPVFTSAVFSSWCGIPHDVPAAATELICLQYRIPVVYRLTHAKTSKWRPRNNDDDYLTMSGGDFCGMRLNFRTLTTTLCRHGRIPQFPGNGVNETCNERGSSLSFLLDHRKGQSPSLTMAVVAAAGIHSRPLVRGKSCRDEGGKQNTNKFCLVHTRVGFIIIDRFIAFGSAKRRWVGVMKGRRSCHENNNGNCSSLRAHQPRVCV